MKPEGNKIVHSMVFPVVTYDNNRVSDDVKYLYTHLYWKTSMDFWVKGKKIFPEEESPKYHEIS